MSGLDLKEGNKLNEPMLEQKEESIFNKKNLSGRELIIQSATQLFVKKGFNGVSMREIAETSRMTKAALYYHFQDKEALTIQIFNDYFSEIELDIQKILEQSKPVREKTAQFVTTIMNQSPDKLGVIHLIFIESSHLGMKFRQEIGQKYHALFLGSIENLLKDGIKQGEIRDLDVKQTAQLLFGMMYSYFHPQQPKYAEEIQKSTDLVLQIFFEGVQKR